MMQHIFRNSGLFKLLTVASSSMVSIVVLLSSTGCKFQPKMTKSELQASVNANIHLGMTCPQAVQAMTELGLYTTPCRVDYLSMTMIGQARCRKIGKEEKRLQVDVRFDNKGYVISADVSEVPVEERWP